MAQVIYRWLRHLPVMSQIVLLPSVSDDVCRDDLRREYEISEAKRKSRDGRLPKEKPRADHGEGGGQVKNRSEIGRSHLYCSTYYRQPILPYE